MRLLLTGLTAVSVFGFCVTLVVHLSTWFLETPAWLAERLAILAFVLVVPAGMVSRRVALNIELRRAFTPAAQGWTRSATLLCYATFGNATIHFLRLVAAGFGGETYIGPADVRVVRMMSAFTLCFFIISWAIWDSRRRAIKTPGPAT